MTHLARSAATGNVLVVYGLFTHPLRSTIEDHLLAFRRYSARRVFHLNARVQDVPRHILRRRYDMVVFQTTFLSNRWAPELFLEMCERIQPLKALSGVRVAMPQDEFLRTKLVCDFIDDFDVDVVCSVAPESEWPKIYPTVDRQRVRFHRVLTGYLDDRTVDRVERIVASIPEQDVDIGYRAWRGASWLGRHGTLKGTIADAVKTRGPAHGLRLDVTTDDDATLLGDDWFRFLARCRYTVGIEGGASILDFDGSIKERTERYEAEHPGVGFDEVERACFPDEDGSLALFAISPRHLEACATRTCQVLVEGFYNGILEPGRHYIELRSDLSNLDEVLASLGDEARRRRIVEDAHRDVVASGRYTYRAMVEDVERVALGAAAVPAAAARDRIALILNRAAERVAWARVAYVLRWQSRAPIALLRGVIGRLGALRPGRRAPVEPADGRKTVVSVTPIAVERDSRTYKAAASMARLGYRSIVVEGEASARLRDGLPFELITVGGVPAAAVAEPPTSANGGPDPTALGRLAARAPGPVYRMAGPAWRAALRVVGPLATFARTYPAQCRAMAAALPPADLYYLHSQYHFPAVWWRRKPFVYDAHDLYWTLRRDGRPLPFADRVIWGIWDRIERLTARRADACVTVGEGVARHAQDRFGRRFAVVRNLHDARLDMAEAPGIRTRLGLAPDTFILAVAGNFKRGMAVEPMQRALAKLPARVHLAFIGARYQELAAEELGVADRVHVLPPVPPTHIVPLLAQADLAPIPYYPSSISVRHALPNGFFLAVAAGVPVLYPNRLDDLRELAERYELGWEIDPERDESIAAAVQRILAAPDELAARRARLREVRDELSWATDEDELARVVAGVLEDGR